MRSLQCGIGLSDLGPWLAQPEAELTEQALTLAHLELHATFVPEKFGQRRPVPHLRWKAELAGVGPQRYFHLCQLLFIQAAGPARSFALRQSGQPVRFEVLHPVHHGARRVAQKSGDLRTAQPLGHQQNPVQAMIVARGIVAANFILKCHNHVFLVGNG